MAVHQQGRRHPRRGAEVAPSEIVEVFEIGVFISAPIVEVPYVQPAPVVEKGAFAPTVTQVHLRYLSPLLVSQSFQEVEFNVAWNSRTQCRPSLC